MKNKGIMDINSQLAQIEASLLGVISAITQTPSKNVRRARLASSIATAKVTGVATTAGIFGLVSTLGTAGTGTAIGTLSGAASTSATLAWVGGLVGGGMAAGAIVLPLTGIAAGATATMYLRRKLHGRPRLLNELHPFEHEILFGADNLIRPLDILSKEGVPEPTSDELRLYAHDGLKPLISCIERYLTEATPTSDQQNDVAKFTTTIKPKYQKQLRQHCRVLKKHADVLSRPRHISRSERFGSWLAKLVGSFQRRKPRSKPHLASVALAVTFQRLLDGQPSGLGAENDLVLNALRRSTNRLEDASIEELSEYVQSLSPSQLAGVVSNTKGIYHELLFIEMHNASGAAESAEIMEATNFPGADVQFFFDGEIVREVQLKAVSSPTLVHEHLQRYPDIEILVTEETAAILDGINSSGLSNAVLTRDVSDRMQELQGEGLLDDITDGIITSAFVTSGFVVWNVLTKRSANSVNFKQYLTNAGIAVGTASAIESAIALAGN
jgi:hypothetical protein